MSRTSAVAWLDRERRATADRIRKHGVSVALIGYGECLHCAELGIKAEREAIPFAYTIGLFGIGHPELLIFETDMEVAGAIVNDLAAMVRQGAVLMPGQYVRPWPGTDHRGYIEEVPNPGQILCQANEYYWRPPAASVPAVQITFSDHDGRMPWDEGYQGDPAGQPRPGQFFG